MAVGRHAGGDPAPLGRCCSRPWSALLPAGSTGRPVAVVQSVAAAVPLPSESSASLGSRGQNIGPAATASAPAAAAASPAAGRKRPVPAFRENTPVVNVDEEEEEEEHQRQAKRTSSRSRTPVEAGKAGKRSVRDPCGTPEGAAADRGLPACRSGAVAPGKGEMTAQRSQAMAGSPTEAFEGAAATRERRRDRRPKDAWWKAT